MQGSRQFVLIEVFVFCSKFMIVWKQSHCQCLWLGGLTVACKLVTLKLQVCLSVGALPGNDLGQVVHTHVPLFTKQYNFVSSSLPGR